MKDKNHKCGDIDAAAHEPGCSKKMMGVVAETGWSSFINASRFTRCVWLKQFSDFGSRRIVTLKS